MSGAARLGDRAVRIPRPGGCDARRLLEIVRAWPGVVDANATEAWIGVYFDSAPDLSALPLASLEAARGAPPARGRAFELCVRYDGADLADVAAEAGLSPEQIALLHSGAEYEVSFLGFLPGFAYLAGLPQPLVVTRRSAPRPRVPKNAVALAGPYTAVYPSASPGGWRLIGTLVGAPELFSARGALLERGDRVRFRGVT